MSTAIDIVNNLINSDESDNQEPVENVEPVEDTEPVEDVEPVVVETESMEVDSDENSVTVNFQRLRDLMLEKMNDVRTNCNDFLNTDNVNNIVNIENIRELIQNIGNSDTSEQSNNSEHSDNTSSDDDPEAPWNDNEEQNFELDITDKDNLSNSIENNNTEDNHNSETNQDPETFELNLIQRRNKLREASLFINEFSQNQNGIFLKDLLKTNNIDVNFENINAISLTVTSVELNYGIKYRNYTFTNDIACDILDNLKVPIFWSQNQILSKLCNSTKLPLNLFYYFLYQREWPWRVAIYTSDNIYCAEGWNSDYANMNKNIFFTIDRNPN